MKMTYFELMRRLWRHIFAANKHDEYIKFFTLSSSPSTQSRTGEKNSKDASKREKVTLAEHY